MNKKNNKINLLISIAGLHHGGAERVVATLCNNLDPDKFSVTVAWHIGLGMIGKELIAQGHDIIGLPEIQPNYSPYGRFLVLKKLIQKKNIDIVHCHDTGTLADAVQCRLFGAKIRVVHTFHFGNYPNIKSSHLILETIFSRLANKLVAVGYEQAKQIRKKLHLSAARINTIYNGVELSVVSNSAESVSDSELKQDLTKEYRNKYGNPVIIGSISTLTKQKGLTYLLDAANILKKRKLKFLFLIAGDGPLRQELEEKSRQLNLRDVVHFLSWVPQAAKNLLPSIDIFCQPSLWEANSIVLLEAMATGLPIVTTKVGESEHVVDEKECGNIVEPGDATSMADALAKLITEPELRKQMGIYAKEKFLANYTIDKMINSYEKLYESLA